MAGYDPPPFFKQGPAPLALLTFYVALAISLSILDARFRYLEVVRQAVSVVTHPIQVIAHLPVQGFENVTRYFASLGQLQEDNARHLRAQLDNATRLQRIGQLETENEQLRKLLAVRARQDAGASSARVLYAARDPFTRRIIIDQGGQQGVLPGQPVIDELGIVGQVTRVFPLVSEVTLSTDKDQSVPVQIIRNGLRSVSFGLGNGQMELRYMPANADVQVGDVVVTSGLDGIYHAGFPVARVDKIERDTTYSFARILCSPIAGVENHNVVLLLKAKETEPPKPAEVEASFSGAEVVEKPVKSGRRVRRAAP